MVLSNFLIMKICGGLVKHDFYKNQVILKFYIS